VPAQHVAKLQGVGIGKNDNAITAPDRDQACSGRDIECFNCSAHVNTGRFTVRPGNAGQKKCCCRNQ
jgi:hypothetical protein